MDVMLRQFHDVRHTTNVLTISWRVRRREVQLYLTLILAAAGPPRSYIEVACTCKDDECRHKYNDGDDDGVSV